MRQLSGRPRPRYLVYGIAVISGWDDGYFHIEGCNAAGVSRGTGSMAESTVAAQATSNTSDSGSEFDHSALVDERERTIALVLKRRGQSDFRRTLLTAYDGRCAITGRDGTQALEAAHICPYLGPDTNSPSNGLLLRADLHTLFDLGLITIEPETMSVVLASELRNTEYATLEGERLHLPSATEWWPSPKALAEHKKCAGL